MSIGVPTGTTIPGAQPGVVDQAAATAETRRMARWAGHLIERERRLEMGLEHAEAAMDRAKEDLEAMKAALAPSKRSSRFTAALERLEDRLGVVRQEVMDARVSELVA